MPSGRAMRRKSGVMSSAALPVRSSEVERGRGVWNSPASSNDRLRGRVGVREGLLLDEDPVALPTIEGHVGLVERDERVGVITVLVEAQRAQRGGERVGRADRVGANALASVAKVGGRGRGMRQRCD